MSTIPSTAHAVPSTGRINLRLAALIAAVAVAVVIVIVALSGGPKAAGVAGVAATQSQATSMHYYGTGAAPSARPHVNLSPASPTRASQPQPQQHFYGLNP